MYLLYCFIAYLGLSMYNASKNVAESRGDFVLAHNQFGYLLWFIIVGLILPFVTMFFFTEWYWAILYNIGLIIGAMIIGNIVATSESALPSIIISVISLALFIYLIF